jgi:hypothetical protein
MVPDPGMIFDAHAGYFPPSVTLSLQNSAHREGGMSNIAFRLRRLKLGVDMSVQGL